MKSLNSLHSDSVNPGKPQQEASGIVDKYSGLDYLNATGEVKFGLTNDYLFRIVFQENKLALKGLLCSILKLNTPASII